MIYTVRDRAMTSFQAENYPKAVEMFEIVRKFEWRERLSTIQLLSTSYARSGDHNSAVTLLKSRLESDPDNISLLYYLSLLYTQELEDPKNAFMLQIVKDSIL